MANTATHKFESNITTTTKPTKQNLYIYKSELGRNMKVWFWFWFYGISTIVGYSMPSPFLCL